MKTTSSSRRPTSAKTVLEAIAKRPENQTCADCFTSGPRWVSINIGVFLCIDCSGLHRDLGTHVSKIKSITLDEWSLDLVEFVGGLGNKICNAYYEANLPSTYVRPAPKSSQLKDFIQRKYEYREWVPKGSVFSPADLLRDSKPPISATAPLPSKIPSSTTPKAEELLLDQPVTGKSRHHAKKSQKQKSQRHSTPLLDADIFAADTTASHKPKDSNQNLLMDFWGTKSPETSKTPNTTDLLFSPPQSLGYAIEPPSFRRVQEAKTAGAKEAQLQCITDPDSLCLGPPVFPSILPSATGSAAVAGIDPWLPDETRVARENVVDYPQQTNPKDAEDYFVSAINRNLDKLSVLTSR